MPSNDPPTHSVTIEFDTVGISPSLRFICHADEGADCRTACPRSECEEGCVRPSEHEREPLDYCNNVAWFENGDDVATWIAGGSTSVTLPVEISWACKTHDGPEWAFSTGVPLPEEGSKHG